MLSFTERVAHELEVARRNHAKQNSLHEGYAVLLEEVDELWDEVKKKTKLRNKDNVLNELVQIAAMAQRTAEDLGLV